MPEVLPLAGSALSRALPFPGLRPYDEADADWFFGRSGEINDLLKRLRRLHFIAMVGASGCGKSSLVRAGVLPYIREGFLDAEWQIVTFRPGERPIANLAEALGTEIVKDPNDPRNVLRSGSQGLVRAMQAAKRGADHRVLILVDQFEELFQYVQRTGESGQNETKEFLKLLLAAAGSEDVEVYVIVTMRLEWLNECASYVGLAEAINAGIYLVPQMERRQFGQAILGPLEAAKGSLTSALYDRMLNDLDNKQDQLPVLQHALLRLWERNGANQALDIAGYEAVGTFSNCLSAHAEEVYSELTDAQKRVAEMLFRNITQVSKNRKIRRAQPISEVMRATGIGFAELAEVIGAFSKTGRSFLITTQGALTPASIVDISHEALIRQWTTLNKWVDHEEERKVRLQRLEFDAAEWDTDRGMKECLYSGAKLDRAEELVPVLQPGGVPAVFLQKSRRAYFWSRAWRYLALSGAAVALIGIAFILAGERARTANAATAVAQAKQKQADEDALAAKQQGERTQVRMNELLQQIKDAGGSATKLTAIAQSFQAKQIYLRYEAGSSDVAKAAQTQLQRGGFTVAGFAQLSPSANKAQTQVGYYHPEDKADAVRISALVGQQVAGGAAVQMLPNPKDVFPRGQFEVLVVPPPVAVASSGSGSGGPGTAASPAAAIAPVLPRPTIIAMLSSPTVVQGQEVTLSWDSANASEVKLNGVGVDPKGSKAVKVLNSQTFTLTVSGNGFSDVKTLKVEATAPPPPAAVANNPAPAPVADPNAPVKAALNKYAKAQQTMRPDLLADVFTYSGAGYKRALSTLKQDSKLYRSTQETLDCTDIKISGQIATATCRESREYTRTDGTPEAGIPSQRIFHLFMQGNEWKIDTIQ